MPASRVAATIGVVLTGAAGAPAGAATLDELLTRVGLAEKVRNDTACRVTEDLRLEQFASDGALEGTLYRTTVVTQRGPDPLGRTVVSERVDGTVSDRLRVSPKAKSTREDRLGAFHPDTQALYRFELLPPGPAGARVSFAPREPSEHRLQGIATIDPATGWIVRLESSLSDLPFGVQSLDIDVAFHDSPCGNTARRIVVKGFVKVLFYKLRFRSTSELSGYELVAGS